VSKRRGCGLQEEGCTRNSCSCPMWLLDFLQNLSLTAMFIATVAIGLAVCWIMLVLVRVGIRSSGVDPAIPLPIRDTLIDSISAIFALMMAFSAAGIWNDSWQANTAVQREANALENVLALARSLPADLAEKMREAVNSYARKVVDRDWPAMKRKIAIDDPIYETSDKILVDLINTLSVEHSRITSLPTLTPLLGQIVEARSARLARITLASAGVSLAQWLAMSLIALGALLTVALCHNHRFGIQALTMSLYTLAGTAAFFVILAHDRPFVGAISVSPRQ
jgi:Protein of unknown function (DUF4239)